MKKFFLSTLLVLIFTTIFSVFYLSFFGYETKRFNEVIKDIIRKNDKNIDLTFEKVKISMDIKKFSIFVGLSNPELSYFKNPIPLENLKASIHPISMLQGKNSIKKVNLNTGYMDLESIKPAIIRSKPSNAKTVLLNNIEKSKFKVNLELDFDEDLKLTDQSIFNGSVKQTKIKIKDEYLIQNINFNFFYKQDLLSLKNFSGKFNGVKVYDSIINYKSHVEGHKIHGTLKTKLDSSGQILEKIFSTFGFNEKIFTKLSLKGYSENQFNLSLDKTLALKKVSINSEGVVNSLSAKIKNKINNQLLKKEIEKIELKDLSYNLKYNDKKIKSISIDAKTKIHEEFHHINFSKKGKTNKIEINFSKKENPIKIPLIHYSFDQEGFKLSTEYYSDSRDNIFFKTFNFIAKEDLFMIKDLKLDKNYNLLNFDKISVQTKLNGDFNNDFSIVNKKKIEIKGTKFDAKLLAKELSGRSKNDFLKNISKNIEIDFDQVLTNTEFPLGKFRLIGRINKGNFVKLSGKSEFANGKYLDVSLKKQESTNLKILEIHSGLAKPLINSYKFFDGLEEGNLVYISKFNNQGSTGILEVNNFRLIKAPAFAQLLTLADLKGLTDTLKGEGISFDTLVVKYRANTKTMDIEEIFMIGPSISILIDGYVEKESGLISLRGTLVPAKTLNTLVSKIPVIGDILIGKKVGEGLFGVSFKIKGLPNQTKTTVNPVKTLTPRFIT